MYVTSKFTVGSNFVDSAKEAIRAEYTKNGYPPNEVMVHPETQTGGAQFIAVMLEGEMYQIPVRVRDDLRIGFSLKDDEAMLDICNPYSTLE